MVKLFVVIFLIVNGTVEPVAEGYARDLTRMESRVDKTWTSLEACEKDKSEYMSRINKELSGQGPFRVGGECVEVKEKEIGTRI